MMNQALNPLLILGAGLSALAALLHLGCIVFGAPWYRAFGAGEKMARLAERGHPMPTVATLCIAVGLLVFAAYALSGAGVIERLPLAKWALCGITAVYLLRAVGFVFLMPLIPENSLKFWWVSSAICLGFGLVHLMGLRQVWPQL
jgi:fatty acid desaturase